MARLRVTLVLTDDDVGDDFSITSVSLGHPVVLKSRQGLHIR